MKKTANSISDARRKRHKFKVTSIGNSKNSRPRRKKCRRNG